MARAKAFYESVFQTQLEQLPKPPMEGGDGVVEMWMFPGGTDHEKPGCSGAICKMDGRVTASGGSLYKEKFSIGDYGFIAIACDTESNTIGLHSLK